MDEPDVGVMTKMIYAEMNEKNSREKNMFCEVRKALLRVRGRILSQFARDLGITGDNATNDNYNCRSAVNEVP